ncbi:uncharacterized protein LOC131955798 isoform X2 [Physella acuta]|uniref:uncharacterized protein LOC131955798 isoform X2 n=1 Tax=Physella acuta TaxID=109671 RepID=UPI0027DE6B3F|nr:uncharacterized protein LOC131955798 isoform X2 [Physella acuta]
MIIIRHCNRTHQAGLGCENGYLYVPSSHPSTSVGECDNVHLDVTDRTQNERTTEVVRTGGTTSKEYKMPALIDLILPSCACIIVTVGVSIFCVYTKCQKSKNGKEDVEMMERKGTNKSRNQREVKPLNSQ